MTVVITDNRTNPTNNEADSTTGWTGSNSLSLITSNPNPVELTGSLGTIVSTTTQDVRLAIASKDFTAGELLYVWMLPQGIMDTELNGGQAVILGDGTVRTGYHVGGSDKASFRHNSASVGWQCAIIDTANLPSVFTDRQGSEVNLDKSAITEVGAMYKTLAKSVGGAVNCFTDIIRYGNGGLTISGGGSGTEGKFSEIAIEDSSDASLKAFGICHEVASGVFGLQGPLTFGDVAGTNSVDFKEQDTTVVFEDRGIGTDKYYVHIEGNATGSTDFQLGIKSGTDGGSNGCSLVCPTGVGAAFDASDANVEKVLMYGGILSGYDQLTKFSADATNGPNHEVYAYTFSGCAQIDPGKVQFKNNTIVNSVDANGGLLLDADGTGNMTGLSFISDGTGHAIYITATGTYDFTDWNYSGYGADDSTDAVVYNDSGGAVTINKSGGSAITVRNGAGASTTIVADPITISVTVYDDSTGLLLSGARVYLIDDATKAVEYLNGETTGTGIVSDSIQYAADVPVVGWVREWDLSGNDYTPKDISGIITSAGLSITVRLTPI